MTDTDTQQGRVLVVEDDPDIRDLVRYRLERAGFEVTVAADGETGLRLAQEEPPDLAILDIMLPKLDGYEITRRLRSDERTRALPVIMLTARAQDDDLARGFAVGADDYLRKPFSPQELRSRVAAVLARRAAS
jgi:DNA-binding response OmpR family regulator